MNRFVLSLVVLGLFGASSARAEPSGPPRLLNGHHFIPSVLVPDPFAVSFFRTGTGADLSC